MIPLTNYLQHPTSSAIRDGFGQGLVEIGEKNENVVALCADLTEAMRMNSFAEKFPNRSIQTGVAEQNLIGLAAGMALAGKIPYPGSFAVFSPGRSFDQIRVSVCYSKLNVKVVGGYSGFGNGGDGASHQAFEDVAMMRVLPNMTVVVPCDFEEARKMMHASLNWQGPMYLRPSRSESLNLTIAETPFEIGKALTMREGNDVAIIANGPMVAESLLAAEELAQTERLTIRVINLHTVKPLDEQAILLAAQETGAIVTAEEHQIAGGMGSAVAEFLASNYPVPIEFVGMNDTFGESGTIDELKTKYGLDKKKIKEKIKRVMERKVGRMREQALGI